jgi:hypothetical protein
MTPTDVRDYGEADGARQAELFRSHNENGLAGFTDSLDALDLTPELTQR